LAASTCEPAAEADVCEAAAAEAAPRADLRISAHRPLLGIALRIAAMASMALLYGLVKLAGAHGASIFEIVFYRNAFAFLPLGLYTWRTIGFGALRTKRPLGHLARSAVGLTGMICSFLAVQHLPLTEATALQFAAPLFMTALSAPLLGEQVGRHRWAAVAVGFIGVLIMARPIPGHMNLPGVTFGVLAALGVAGASIAIRQISDTEPGPTIVFYFTLAGTVVGLAGSLLFGWTRPDLATLGLLVLAGLVGGVGQILQTEALRAAPVGVVAPFDYSQLVFAAFLGLALWGELPRPATLLGAAVVAASGLYILHRELRRFRAA
jgi:drug/metabolite transporter (DMT)-like permease